MNVTPQTLSEREAAEYIGMSRQFLRRCRMTGPNKSGTRGPVFLRLPNGRSIRYLISDLDAWLQAARSEEAV